MKPQEISSELSIENLTTLDDLEQMMRYDNRNSCVCNEQGEVIGLNLRANKLTDDKVNFIWSLNELEALNLSENRFQSIAVPEGMSKLKYLNVSENKELRTLTFPHLKDLKVAEFSECALMELTFEGTFDELFDLYAQKNQLEQVTFKGACPKLRLCDLSENKLTKLDLPGGFTDLKYLYLVDNQLEEVHFANPSPKALKTLHLRGNQLDKLPDNLVELENMEALYLHGNPLSTVPAEFIAEDERKSSWDNIRNYLESLQGETKENDEVRLIFLGNSTSGKSSLLRYLRQKVFDESLSSTHGIINEIYPIDVDFKINIWDFGGQEYYHATHRLFLSDNAVTLILFEEKTNEQGILKTEIKLYEHGELVKKSLPLEHFPYSYWLENLDHFCQDRANNVVLVQSKMDLDNTRVIPISDAERKKYRLKEEFIYRVSVKGAHEGVRKYERDYEGFEEELLELLKKAKESYPFSIEWLNIKDALRAKADAGEKMMTYGEYEKFCEEISPGISQKAEGQTSQLDTLTLSYLREIGVILYYPEIEEIKDFVFVNPKWVTDAIYKVLDYSVIQNEGRFDKEHVESVVKDFEADKLIALMEEFELIFQVKNSDVEYVAPQYLPAENREKDSKSFKKLLEKCKTHAFTLRYPKVLPKSIMTRFICRYGNLADDIFWKNGIVFENEGLTFIVERISNNEIQVKCEELNPLLIATFFADLHDINGKNPNIELSVDGNNYVKIGNLEKQLPTGNQKIESVTGELIDLTPFDILGSDPHARFEKGRARRGIILKDQDKFVDDPEADALIDKIREKHGSAEAQITPSSEDPLKIFFFESSSADQVPLNTAQEMNDMRDEIRRGTQRDLYKFEFPRYRTDYDSLLRHLLEFKPNIIHFSGHGKQRGIVILDENGNPRALPTTSILRLFQNIIGQVRLVILNGCYTTDQARYLSKLGIYVIGNNASALDKAAIAFSKAFYISLSEQADFELAFDNAIGKVEHQYGAEAELIDFWKDGEKINS